MNGQKHFYVRRKDGQVFAIPEYTVADTLNQGFELIGEVISEETFKKEETLAENTKQEEFACILCGFVGKNGRAIRMHRTKSHA